MHVRRLFPVTLCLLLTASCSGKKEEPESAKKDISVTDAPGAYGKVLGKAYQDARKIEVLLPLQQSIQAFRAQEGRYPSSLEELVQREYISEIPRPPAGRKLVYDSASGSVTVSGP